MDSRRLLEGFFELIAIDSPSKEEGALAQHLAALLETIGARVHIDDTAADTGSDTGNLIATLPGDLPGTLVLSAHLDTVDPCRGVEAEIVDGRICSIAETILGADDKAGIAIALEAMRTVAESGVAHPTIKAVLTVQEEVGLLGAKALSAEDASGDLVLVLDSDGAPGTIVVGAPFHHTFTATFTGRAAHSGVSPEKGISAITAASTAIASLSWGRHDELTTSNIGKISGGIATNIVAPSCVVEGECRSLDGGSAQARRDLIDSAFRAGATEMGTGLEMDWTLEYEGFNRSAEDPSVAFVAESARSIGLEPIYLRSGGGSDANVFAGHGLPVLVLGIGMQGFHTVDESIAISDLEDATRLVLAVIDRMGVERIPVG